MPVPHPFQTVSPSAFSRLWSPTGTGAVSAALLTAFPKVWDRDVRSLLPTAVASKGGLPAQLCVAAAAFTCGYGAAHGADWLRWKLLKWLFSYQGWVYGITTKNKVWAFLVKLLSGSGPFGTYAFQAILPKQPLPNLDDTLDLWLSVADQLVSKEDFELTLAAVERFRTHEGPTLQEYLKTKAQNEVNYVSDYWRNVAYLACRDSIAINNNYYSTHTVQRTTDQLARAAAIIRAIGEAYELLSRERLPPVRLQDAVPLCMSGYRYVFNTVRVPGDTRDSIERYPGHTHLVVIRQGHFFKFDLFPHDGKNRRLLTAEELKIQLQNICDTGDKLPTEPPVAALTANDRKTWAKQREVLAAKNPVTLKDMESSMFVVSMDNITPEDVHDKSKLILTGRGNDRWFDKSITTVTFPNATSGSNVEHSVIDAMIFSSVFEYIVLSERYENGDVPRNPNTPPRSLPTPHRMTWDVDGMEEQITDAEKQLLNTASDLDCYVLSSTYGKGFMKKKKFSPDGYIQMALQLAYYNMNKEVPKTYEPSTARMFELGRTETVHPVSPNSVAWVKAMTDPLITPQTCIELLRKAIKKQTRFRLDATVGKGCDRHLLALYCASRELDMDIPGIFLDKAWRLPFKLSTSQTPTRVYDYGADVDFNSINGGFGPSCADGYGVSYVILGDDIVNIAITSWKTSEDTDSTRFATAIVDAMESMKLLLSS